MTMFLISILFEYPRLLDYGAFGTGGFGGRAFGGGYIKPRIKLEFGARGETEPSQSRTITPYLAAEFPDEMPDAEVQVSTLVQVTGSQGISNTHHVATSADVRSSKESCPGRTCSSVRTSAHSASA